MNQKAKMGRPRQSAHERQEKIDRIIDTAQTLFIEKGFPSVSMRRIAEKAGMGTMTLYQYFPNKNAILHHIWAGFFDDIFSLARKEVEKEGDPKEKMKRLCMTYLNYWVDHQDRFRIVFLNEDRASSSDQFFINHANIAQEMLAVVGPIMQELWESADYSSMMIFLESLICFINGIALNVITISEYPWNDYEKYVDTFLDAAL